MFRLSMAGAIAALVAFLSIATATSKPSFLGGRKAGYTPLLFFKVPVGTMEECTYKVSDLDPFGDFFCGSCRTAVTKTRTRC